MKLDKNPMLSAPLSGIDDPEGAKIPNSMPFVVDAHVHVFPKSIFQSIWNWFDQYGYPIRYRLNTEEVFNFLLSRGVGHIVAMQYAHKPGIAKDLNRYMAGHCNKYAGKVTGMATVFPGEEGVEETLDEAFRLGLKGVKLHAHVQCFDMNSAELDIIYQTCSDNEKPVVLHAGREPKSPAYKCDPYQLCSAEKLERVIRKYPRLKLCVPHLGMDEFSAYQKMVERYENLWLDTTMALTDFFPGNSPPSLDDFRADRVMYGTDFPNLPFSWDREIRCIDEAGLSEDSLNLIMGKNAIEFYSIEMNDIVVRV
jgi:hypothetical protein